MKKGNLSTQDMLGIKSFSRNGIQTNGHGEIVYFTVKPTNISVLSRVAVGIKIKHLMQLLSAQPDIEIICLDARENFDDNKLYLDARLEDETNAKIRDLLERDKQFLDEIQVQMSTAREFRPSDSPSTGRLQSLYNNGDLIYTQTESLGYVDVGQADTAIRM